MPSTVDGNSAPPFGGAARSDGARPIEEFGPYFVYEQLGYGGMASVHRAETRGAHGFRRSVALKRMLPHAAGNPDLVQSFIREARLASNLHHANVAQTYDLGKVGDTYFIAMELVPGHNLREILRHCARVCGPMPLSIVLEILSQICDALDYAHGLTDDSGRLLGIVHRDVSPANVIISDGGVVKLIDFGIAKATATGMQTMSGTIKGKFGYLAPEYLDGSLDARADLFAVGIIAHELLANRPLFQGPDDMDTLMNIRTMTVPLPSQYRPGLAHEIDSIIMTALKRNPDERWQRASAMRTALTSEIRRLGLGVVGQHLVDWVDEAFRMEDDDSSPDISISRGTAASIARGSDSGQPPARLDSDSDVAHTTLLRRSSRRQAVVAPVEPPLPIALPLPAPVTVTGAVTLPDSPSAGLRASAPPGSPSPALRAAVPPGSSSSQMRTVLGVVPASARPSQQVAAARAGTSAGHAKPSSRLVTAILVLLIAGVTGAVVYFALPFFT